VEAIVKLIIGSRGGTNAPLMDEKDDNDGERFRHQCLPACLVIYM